MTRETEIVSKENRRTGETDVPHLVISIPVADFQKVEWATLAAIAAEERRERDACPA